jgi:drug/metabolite transporter (DMT)-like permease
MQQQSAGARRVAAFALMALIWGLTWLPMKLASEVVPPIFLATVRFVLAALCYLALALANGFSLRLERPRRVAAASLLITTGCYSFVSIR